MEVLSRDPLSQSAKPPRNGSAHPPLYAPRREHLGELYEQAGNKQPVACLGVISAGEHPGLMQAYGASSEAVRLPYSGKTPPPNAAVEEFSKPRARRLVEKLNPLLYLK